MKYEIKYSTFINVEGVARRDNGLITLEYGHDMTDYLEIIREGHSGIIIEKNQIKDFAKIINEIANNI